MTNVEAAIKGLKSLVEVRRKYGDMQTMKDEIECLEMGVKELTAISELSKSLKAVNCYDMDEKVLIGFNMAVAIFNKCFGEICALKNEQPEQNVGMCQQNVGEMSEKQTDGDLTSVLEDIVLGKWIYKDFNWYCSNCNQRVSTPGYVGTAEFMKEHFKICNHCGAKMEESRESQDE